MASQSKTKAVKFEVGQLVLFSGHRVGRVSRIAKNGAIYVVVLGETTVANQTREELRVKKADLQLVSDVLERTGDAVSVEDYVRHVIRNNISCDVSSNAKLADDGVYKLAPDYIPSPGCLEYCEWEGSADAARVFELVGLDLVKLANLYTGKREAPSDKPQSKAAEAEIPQDTPPVIEEPKAFSDAAQEIVAEMQESQAPALPAEPVQSTLALESTEPAAASSLESAEPKELADATYALRELTFSVTRHSILTAFIDVALNKDIAGYHHQVAGNLKNLMAAAFDPVHDPMGYARINTWTMAALELVVKHKERVAKMLSQPIEAAPIKMDRVTKLGMWIDNMMNSKGIKGNDMTSAYDSCYMYDAIGKKLEACAFVVVEVIQSGATIKVKVPKDAMGYYTKHLTAQSAISARQQHGVSARRKSPDWHIHCGIVPVYKSTLSMQKAVEEMLADVISSLK